MLQEIPASKRSYTDLDHVLQTAAAAYAAHATVDGSASGSPQFAAREATGAVVDELSAADQVRLVMRIERTVGLAGDRLITGGRFRYPETWTELTGQLARRAVGQAAPVLTRDPAVPSALAPEVLPNDPVAGDRTTHDWPAVAETGPPLAERLCQWHHDLTAIVDAASARVAADDTRPAEAVHRVVTDRHDDLMGASPVAAGALIVLVAERYGLELADLRIDTNQFAGAVFDADHGGSWVFYLGTLLPDIVRWTAITLYDQLRAQSYPRLHGEPLATSNPVTLLE